MEARCQCGLVNFPIPHSEPITIVVCHCNKCKLATGSAFHITAIFPYFEIAQSTKDNFSDYSMGSDSGNIIDSEFCKGCGNRMIYIEARGPKQFISVSAPRIVNFDWGMFHDKRLTTHWWTEQAVVAIPEGFKSWKQQAPKQEIMEFLTEAGQLDPSRIN